ncbi:MAG: hypothetical protein IPO09_01825 [Anaeromyxobacter sp.]|nr:hypothetical protein [Anaeromyxobacter sp.]MBL0278102.1 hypothetical protein [Anaeromyxobacter sp.]
MPRRAAWLRALLAVLLAAPLAAAAAPRAPPARAAAEPAPAGVSPPADDAVLAGSCQVARDTCIDYEGAWPGGLARARCAQARGTWRAGACPSAGRLGTCTQRETGTDDRTLVRSFAPLTEKAARAACKKVPRAVFLRR